MSSCDTPSRRLPGAAGGEFAPLSGPRITGSVRAASVFPDFDARRPDAARPASEDVPDALAQAREESFAAGVAAGRDTAAAELAGATTAFAAAVEEIARFRSHLVARYEQELLQLALGVARKVVQRELAEHPEHWLAMLREAVLSTLDRETIRIRVGTVLHRYLVDQLPRLRALLEDVKELELVEDVALDGTGCVVESRYGDLDLGVDGQIEAIRAALTGGDGG